ncbi:ABC transporter permease [Peribacillus psychrosaccharolyticus]|uniref:Transport permease protein n=1 Tax=Peribacillus psychrosaccharolyticus TaxID=1407 RepID=A0A974NK14_PERPY|nr:ABC transporter permease [Peribacillus psychrosaccharolyticus]MEC2055456.1 ABC transporter permease [Peribacillus psychrosaccharolyticus]MED3743514.1 ABC transporter permease [Peribacillus psychrosaccharolyticus]QQS99136.1 ABC transporter permease [Peribacillus psychrosaccharolyticus]
MSFLTTVIKEQIQNFYLIRRLSLYEMKSTNKNNYLGMLWELLNPAIQVVVFYFVFGIGIKQTEDIGEVPFFIWMIIGLLVWFFVNPSITQGSKAVYSRIKMVSKMNFPLSVIPTYVIISKFYPHVALISLTAIILQFTGYPISIYFIQLPYFMLSTVIFLIALSLITSTLSTIARDVQMLVQSLMRVLLYVTPILWSPYLHLPDWALTLMKVNPLFYLIEGYRAALLGDGWYIWSTYSLYFWGVVVVMLLIGSALHVKFRKHFIDFL